MLSLAIQVKDDVFGRRQIETHIRTYGLPISSSYELPLGQSTLMPGVAD